MEDIKEVFIDKIDDPKSPMRAEIKDDTIWELAENIKQNGLINPITLKKVGERFEVVAGHRRFTAIKLLGHIKIKAIVRELNDSEAFAIMASENLERKDVDIVDEAKFITEFMNKSGLDAKETAIKLRRSEKYVIDRLLVSEMPGYVQEYLKEGKIKLGVALALGQIENPVIREKWLHLAAEQGISVATAQYQAQDYKANKNLYDGIVEENSESNDLIPPKAVMMRCAIDGNEYDVRLIKHVFIYEGNIELFNTIVNEIRKDTTEN